MPLTTIHVAPALDTFTPLAEHQAQTPEVFFGAKPILHYHAVGARALISRDQVSKLPIFTEAAQAGDALVAEVVDAFVGSENVTLFNNATSKGVTIPYPAITLHAVQTLDDPANTSEKVQGLYMQLELSDPYSVTDEDEPETLELTLIPAVPDGNVQTLFDAVSNCSNLHPDPTYEDEEMDDGDGGDSRIIFEGNVGYEGISGLPGVQRGVADGGLPPPFPGSGGWITAENVSEYFDEEGNWIGGDANSLGEGAGRVRTRDELDGDSDVVNGNGEHETDESKRARTD